MDGSETARWARLHWPIVTEFAHRLARILADRSDTLFGVPGGGPNLDVVGAATAEGMRFVLAHAEASAAIMASTYGLLTGGPSGVVVTRGPGATSAANGAAQATLDRYPLVVITDTVTAAQTPRISHQRFDQRALFQPITVASITASSSAAPDEAADDEPVEHAAADLGTIIDRAAQWPLGAVHLDYDPTATTDQHAPPHLVPPALPPVADRIGPAAELMMPSRRPVVIVGMEAAWLDHQAALTGAEPPIRRLVEELACPVLTTYQAVGLVPTEGTLNAGIYTNGALEQPVLDEADLLLMIGVDTVEPIPTAWRQTAPVITISAADPIDAFIPADVSLHGDLATMAHQLVSTVRHREWAHTWSPDAAAVLRADARRALRPNARPLASAAPGGATGERFSPVTLVDALLDGLAGADQPPVATVDAGAHFLAIMPRWPVARPFDLLISNGLATMGFAVPAAIGAALAHPGRPVLALCGDGGLSMTMAELETIARLDLPITVVVFNDSALSLIAVKQEPGHGGDAAIRYRPTDFATIGRASGLDGFVADSADDVRDLMSESWIKPRLIDARIDPGDYRHLIEATRG